MNRFETKAALKSAAVATAVIQLLSTNSASARDAAAEAQATPGEIIVTARKTSESLIKAPLSVSSISAKTLEAAGLDDVAGVAAFAPGVDISGGIAAQLQGQISIRGISTLVRNIGLETGLGVYVDGVYAGRPENFAQQLVDVASVEIARGPQGTEFGKNTIAGVIQIHTVAPDAEPGGFAKVSIGNYGLVDTSAALGASLSEKVSARGTISYGNHGGYYKHLSGGKDAGSADLLTWRLATKFAASDDLSFTLRGDGLRDRGTPAFFQAKRLAGYPAVFPGNQPLHVNNNRPNQLSRDNNGASLTVDWAADAISVVSITAYRDGGYKAMLDDDQEQVDFVAADKFDEDSRFFSQELRLSGTAGKLRYLAGVYYFDQTVKTNRKLALGAALGLPGEPALTTVGRVKSKSHSLFGRLDYRLTDHLELSAGGRYTTEKKRANFTQGDSSGIFTFLGFPNLVFADDASDGDFSPTASLSYELAQGAHAYVRFARGFKSAAFNVDLASSLEGLTARPEKATSYEAGLKLLLEEGRLGVNLAAFNADYSDLQVSQVLGNGLALTNAANARSQGLEGEMFAQVLPILRLEASGAILDAQYRHFAHCGVPASVGGGVADCTGNDLVLAPHFSAHGAAQLDLPIAWGDIFARADVDYRSSVYFEPTNSSAFMAGNRTLIDLRVGLHRDQWTFTGWAENVTGATYRTYMDDRSAIGVLQTAAYGAPRTYGVSVRTEW